LIISDFIRPRAKDYNFTWSGMISNDSTAYSIHYAHARLFNLIEKAKNESGLAIDSINEIDFGLFKSKHEINLINLLANYEEIIWKSYSTYEPHFIVQYLFQLVRATNLCLTKSYVIGEEKNVALARLLLYQCTKQVIANSLNVLAIKPLNRV
jgi:arginyl-tRNA synthetase